MSAQVPTAARRPVVLLAEEQDDVRVELHGHLTDAGYEVVDAADGAETLDRAAEVHPDVIVLDEQMPPANGVEVLRQLKSQVDLRDIPAIFVTGDENSAAVTAALELGAHDHLSKPVTDAELRARVRAALRVKQLQDDLRRSSEELQRSSGIDRATGMWNRARMEEEAAILAANARRYGWPMAVLLVGIDNYPSITTRYGRSVAGQVLGDVAERLHSALRFGDLVARWTVDEFIIFTTNHRLGALRLAERLRATVGDNAVRLSGFTAVPVTVSVGVSTSDLPKISALTSRADAALHDARRSGVGGVAVRTVRTSDGGDSPWGE